MLRIPYDALRQRPHVPGFKLHSIAFTIIELTTAVLQKRTSATLIYSLLTYAPQHNSYRVIQGLEH